jgi:hypothetical protein
MINFNQMWKDFIKNDGFSNQGPQKKQKLVENTDIYGKINENSEKMLWEVTEDELAHIENAIENMDPDDLAFNSMFDGEMRRIIPFSTLDPDSESGKFIKFWDKLFQGYDDERQKAIGWKWEPNFSSGKVHRNRPVYKTRADFQQADEEFSKKKLDALARDLTGGVIPDEWTVPDSPKRSPETMKIGKLLNKIASIIPKYKEFARRRNPILRGDTEPLTDEEENQAKRLHNALYNLVGNNEAIKHILQKPDEVQKLARWWELTGAALFKGNKSAGKEDTYSIIVTRSPLDILRAGDFKNIQSCHSPPSQGGGGSYYKCIVAEAHGHGAVAYIVRTDQLLDAYGTNSLEEVENNEEFQSEEVFYDDKRPEESGEIEPISRVRLRQFKYESPEYDQPIQLAVPEMRTYGLKFEDFYQTVVNFAHNSQKEQLEAAPRAENDKLDLNKFTIYGGSYEDTQGPSGRAILLTNLFNISRDDVTGSVKQDTSTEDELPDDLRGLEEQYERECQEIKEEWNRRYAAVKTGFNVEDDGAGGAYIEVEGEMTLKWNKDAWLKWPHAGDINDILEEVRDHIYGTQWIADSYPTSLQNIGNHGAIGFTFTIEPGRVEKFTDATGGHEFANDPEYYEIWCQALDEIDDQYNELKEVVSTIARMQGWMEGGKFLSLAREIEYGDIDLFDWDPEVEGEFPEYYDISATTHIYLVESDLANLPQFSYDQWNTLLISRDLRLEFRKLLLAEPKQELNTQYNLSITSRYVIPVKAEVVPEIRYYATFNITEDVPDEMVNLFKHTIEETDDEDLLKATLMKAINNVWGNVKQEQMAEALDKKHTKKDAEYFVKRWKLNF